MNPEQRIALPVGSNGNYGVARVLPHSIEAEEYLLSCCFLDGAEVMPKCEKAKIRPESFYDTKNGILFERLLDLHARQIPIDISIVAEELKNARQLDQVGGYAFLTQVSGRVPTTAQASYFIGRVREQATLRALILAAAACAEECYGYSGDLPELTDNLRRRLDFAINGPTKAEVWPEPVDAATFCADPPPRPPELIEGILYAPGTMLVAGPSKSHKTFSALDAAIAIASGQPWLGYKTTKSNVLYLNLELQDFATQDRVARICSARGIPPPPGLHIWNLRGKTVTLAALAANLQKKVRQHSITVACIDPHYKISSVSDMEENSNDSQGKLLNAMEGLCQEVGSALILTHHFAKGDPSSKNAIDRASGAGVFARWGDVMMTFTPHKEGDAMTVEMSLRNFAPVKPFVVRWEYPRWIRDGQLDPADLQTSRGPKEKHTPDKALRALDGLSLTYSQWEKASEMTESTFKRKMKSLIAEKRVEQIGIFYRKTPEGS